MSTKQETDIDEVLLVDDDAELGIGASDDREVVTLLDDFRPVQRHGVVAIGNFALGVRCPRERRLVRLLDAEVVPGVEPHRVHHHLHHAQPGDAQAFHRSALFVLAPLLFHRGERQMRHVRQLHQGRSQ